MRPKPRQKYRQRPRREEARDDDDCRIAAHLVIGGVHADAVLAAAHVAARQRLDDVIQYAAVRAAVTPDELDQHRCQVETLPATTSVKQHLSNHPPASARY